MKLPFGIHKDKDIEHVPQTYLEWLTSDKVKNIEKYILDEAERELARRRELDTKSSVGKITTDREDVALQSLYACLRRMPDSLFDKDLILDKKFKIRVSKCT